MLSIVIPTLNEAKELPRTVETLKTVAAGAFELIISDCNSSDDTLAVAQGCGARIATDGRSRADATSRGAAIASGQVLLFLHADTRLPGKFDALIHKTITAGAVGGAFDFSFGSHPQARGMTKQKLRLVKVLNRTRFRWHGTYFGDQAIFCRRETFNAIGGFDRTPLFEDARFSLAMRRHGRTAILQPAVKTSPRRFLEKGVLRQLARDLTLMAYDNCGISPRRMWSHYNKVNRDSHPLTSAAATARADS